MPPSSKVCRICLSADVTMCKIANTPLQVVYEKITNSRLQSAYKPVEVCYVCYADLNKCRMVMVNAVRANNVLTALLNRSAKVKKKPVSLTENLTHIPMKPQSSSAECVIASPSGSVEIKSADVEMEYEVLEEPLLASDPIDIPDEDGSEGLDPLFLNIQDDVIYKEEDIGDDGEPEKRKAEAPRNTRETGKKSIVCHICRCTFNHMSNLKKHLHSHSGIKYKCHICHRLFSSKGTFKVHIRKHSDEKIVVSHKCDFCQYISKSKDELQRHLKTHRTGVAKKHCVKMYIRGVNK